MAVEVKKLFGTDGIRGVANQWPLISEFVVRVGQAIGQVIAHESDKPVVVIGRDTRLSGTWASTIETRWITNWARSSDFSRMCARTTEVAATKP